MPQSSCFRMQLRCGDRLLAQIGRSVDQEPVFAVGADRNRCLGVLRPAVACRMADRATAIPLWNAAACRGSQNDDAKHDSSPGRSKHFGGSRRRCAPSLKGTARHGRSTSVGMLQLIAGAYLRAAQAYMLISMPTGTSTIFGVFQDISFSFTNGRLSPFGR